MNFEPQNESLKSHYEILYRSIRNGDLETCYQQHRFIAAYLRSEGAVLLAHRHEAQAEKILKIGSILGNPSLENVHLSNKFQTVGLSRDKMNEFLQAKIIAHLKEGKKSRSDLREKIFGSYANDLVSDKVLSRLVDGINRNIANIINTSASGDTLEIRPQN